MMDLVHSHRFTSLWEQQKRKEWKFDLNKMVSDRVGKRVGVFGYGSIGRQGESTFSLYYQYEIQLRSCISCRTYAGPLAWAYNDTSTKLQAMLPTVKGSHMVTCMAAAESYKSSSHTRADPNLHPLRIGHPGQLPIPTTRLPAVKR